MGLGRGRSLPQFSVSSRHRRDILGDGALPFSGSEDDIYFTVHVEWIRPSPDDHRHDPWLGDHSSHLYMVHFPVSYSFTPQTLLGLVEGMDIDMCSCSRSGLLLSYTVRFLTALLLLILLFIPPVPPRVWLWAWRNDWTDKECTVRMYEFMYVCTWFLDRGLFILDTCVYMEWTSCWYLWWRKPSWMNRCYLCFSALTETLWHRH